MKTKTIITESTHDDVVNLFSTSCYGSQWLACDYDSIAYKTLQSASQDDCLEDKLAKLLLAGKSIVLCDYYAEGDADFYGNLPHEWDNKSSCMVYTITLDDVKNGLQWALDNGDCYEKRYVNNLIDNDGYDLDQPEAEYLCQLIMFGEQIY